MQSRGQALLLPQAKRSGLRLVATTHNGPVTGALTVHYTDGTNAELPITVADWCGEPATGSTTVLAMPHRIRAGSGVDGPPVKLFGLALSLDPTKTVRSVSLPADQRIHLYAITLL